MTFCGEEGTYLGLVAASHFFLLPKHHCNLWGNLQIIMSFISAHRSSILKKPYCDSSFGHIQYEADGIFHPSGEAERGGGRKPGCTRRTSLVGIQLLLQGAPAAPGLLLFSSHRQSEDPVPGKAFLQCHQGKCSHSLQVPVCSPRAAAGNIPGTARFIPALCEGHKGFVCSFLSYRGYHG